MFQSISEDINLYIEKILTTAIPEHKDEIDNIINSISFLNKTNNIHQFYSIPPNKIYADDISLSILWLYTFEYWHAIEAYTPVIKTLLLSPDQIIKIHKAILNSLIINIDKHINNTELQNELLEISLLKNAEVQYEAMLNLFRKYIEKGIFDKDENIVNILSQTHYQDSVQRNLSLLDLDKKSNETQYQFNLGIAYITSLQNIKSIEQLDWPDDIIKPRDVFNIISDKIDQQANHNLGVFALAFIILHEVNHCYKHYLGSKELLKHKSVQELDCDQYALDMVLNNIDDYVNTSKESKDKVIFKRLFGILIAYFFILEITQSRESADYPPLFERFSQFLCKAKNLEMNENSHFWICAASYFYIKIKEKHFEDNTLIFTTAMDLTLKLCKLYCDKTF